MQVEELNRMVRRVYLQENDEDNPLVFEEDSPEQEAGSATWRSAVVVGDSDAQGQIYELMVHLFGEEVEEQYVTVTWVLYPPDELRPFLRVKGRLLETLNHINDDPCAKVRLTEDEASAAIVCETDLNASFVTQSWLQWAINHGLSVAMTHANELDALLA
jgi:hypothetical protein